MTLGCLPDYIATSTKRVHAERQIMAKKILTFWVGSELAFALSFWLFDHEPLNLFTFVSYSIQWLLFLQCIMAVLHEPIRKNKFIFLNFAFFFSISLLFHVYNFLGLSLFPGNQYAKFFFSQYISYGVYFFLLAFAVGYLSLDALFRDFKTAYKYALTLAIVGGFFVYYYHNYIADPLYVYTTGESHTLSALSHAQEEYVAQHGSEPSAETLAQITTLHVWKDGEAIGTLFPEENLQVVKEFVPYLPGNNFIVLLQRPLYMNIIYMCVLSLGFILLFFGYQYMKDPPQGAYIDKLMFLFLIFCTIEIMHAWSFIKSVEWKNFFELWNIGQGVSIFILLLIATFVGLRLRFIRSVRGEFYEQEILASPGSVTRWRDALDDLLVAHFFNRKALLGRLFVSSSDER